MPHEIFPILDTKKNCRMFFFCQISTRVTMVARNLPCMPVMVYPPQERLAGFGKCGGSTGAYVPPAAYASGFCKPRRFKFLLTPST